MKNVCENERERGSGPRLSGQRSNHKPECAWQSCSSKNDGQIDSRLVCNLETSKVGQRVIGIEIEMPVTKSKFVREDTVIRVQNSGIVPCWVRIGRGYAQSLCADPHASAMIRKGTSQESSSLLDRQKGKI